MPNVLVFKPGSVVWIPCELKLGFSPTENHVKIEVTTGERETIEGFIPKDDIRPGETSKQGFVRAVVLNAVEDKVSVVFRGEMLGHSNPVIVPSDWLQEVGRSD